MAQHSLDDWDGDGESEATSAECLSFELRGQWGHFRRVEGNIVKQTYRIPPRTTITGIIAAILGLERDSYYDAFASECSGIAVEPIDELRTMNLPQNTLSTAKEHMKTVPTRGHARVSLPDPTELRQQHNYEVLVDPAYRIDVRLDDEMLFGKLQTRLEEGTSYYPPSLGLSEHLAEVEYLGTFDVKPREAGDTDVDSVVVEAVDDIELAPGNPVRVERSPGFMAADTGGRTTTEFLSVAYSPDAEPVHVRDTETSRVDGRRVMFS